MDKDGKKDAMKKKAKGRKGKKGGKGGKGKDLVKKPEGDDDEKEMKAAREHMKKEGMSDEEIDDFVSVVEEVCADLDKEECKEAMEALAEMDEGDMKEMEGMDKDGKKDAMKKKAKGRKGKKGGKGGKGKDLVKKPEGDDDEKEMKAAR